jgi:hypothetical protein
MTVETVRKFVECLGQLREQGNFVSRLLSKSVYFSASISLVSSVELAEIVLKYKHLSYLFTQVYKYIIPSSVLDVQMVC